MIHKTKNNDELKNTTEIHEHHDKHHNKPAHNQRPHHRDGVLDVSIDRQHQSCEPNCNCHNCEKTEKRNHNNEENHHNSASTNMHDDSKKLIKIKQLEEENLILKNEIKEQRDKLLLELADMKNFCSRVERNAETTKKYAIEELVKQLLIGLDNFDRCLENKVNVKINKEKLQEQSNGVHDGILQEFNQMIETLNNIHLGVELTAKSIHDALYKYGLKLINPKIGDKFDPLFHSAISMESNGDDSSGYTENSTQKVISNVLQKGYMLSERLIRPALVTVTITKIVSTNNIEENKEQNDEQEQ